MPVFENRGSPEIQGRPFFMVAALVTEVAYSPMRLTVAI